MKAIDVEEQKRLQFAMLVALADFCELNGLNYSLYEGTLLGAVRHKGFIPWDDDIDVCMPRKDYDIFLATFSHDYFKAYSCDKTDGYYYPFAKLVDTRTVLYEKADYQCNLGVNIDVFPIDYLPCGLAELKKVYRRYKQFRFFYLLKTTEIHKQRNKLKTFCILIGRFFAKPFSLRKAAIRFSKKQSMQNIRCSNEYAGNAVWGYGIKEAFPRSVYESYKRIVFEGRLFQSIANTDRFLSQIYGGYMELPPIEKRVNKHGASAYWKDE